MSARSSHPCRGPTLTLLANCSACGVEPEPFHIGAGAHPPFPPRSQHVWCTSEAAQAPTCDSPPAHEPLHELRPPPTQHQLHARYRESLDLLEHAALHGCLCELDGAGGDGSSYDGRALPSGVPVVARSICLLNGTRVSLELSGRLRSGDKHLVTDAAGNGLVLRMHWPKGERKLPTWHWPRPLNCTVDTVGADGGRGGGRGGGRDGGRRLACASAPEADEFWRRCRARLGVSDTRQAADDRMWGVMGANVLMQHALGDVDGFPALLGGGCCAYRIGEHMAVPVPVEVRPLFAAVAPQRLQTACAVEGGSSTGAARCAIDLALQATTLLHGLTERHHALLLEHVVRSDGDEGANSSSTDCGTLDFRQFCKGLGAQPSLALCDTDFVGPRAFAGDALRPLPFSTAVLAPRPFSADFVGVGGRPPPGGIVDLPCALANALFRPLSRHFSPLAELSDELAARHEAIVRAAEPEVAQLSFSCIHAWLSTAASAAERLGRLGQVQ